MHLRKQRWILSDSEDVILVQVMTAYLEVLLGFLYTATCLPMSSAVHQNFLWAQSIYMLFPSLSTDWNKYGDTEYTVRVWLSSLCAARVPFIYMISAIFVFASYTAPLSSVFTKYLTTLRVQHQLCTVYLPSSPYTDESLQQQHMQDVVEGKPLMFTYLVSVRSVWTLSLRNRL